MKNKIYYLGIFSGIVTASGCIFKIMHWPLAGILLTIGLLFLSLIFLPVAIANMVKMENDRKLKIFYILTAIVMAINFIGALFKILHWPGAGIIMMIAIPLPFVVLLPVWVYSNGAVNKINCKNILAVMFFFAYFAAISSILALGVSKSVIKDFDTSARILQEKTMTLKENTALFSKYSDINNPVNHEAERLCNKIASVESIILKGGQQELSSKHAVYTDVKPVIETRYLTELKSEIINFSNLVQKQYSSDNRICKYVEETFAIYSDNANDVRWEDAWLSSNVIASAIQSLNLLEFRVRMIVLQVNTKETIDNMAD